MNADVRIGCVCGWTSRHACSASWAQATVQADTETTDPDATVVQAVLGLPSRLRSHRRAKDISLREAAKRIGVSFSTLHRIEVGEDYTVDSLIAVAAYLGEAAS